jgi:hypothetical protein
MQRGDLAYALPFASTNHANGFEAGFVIVSDRIESLGENFQVAVGKICATAIPVPEERRVVAPRRSTRKRSRESSPTTARSSSLAISRSSFASRA